MRNDLTVIYYTHNREKPQFEDNIKRVLLETIDGLPLISVSQKPIDFGKNICVGDVGVSGHNAFRQFQIGAMEAKTKYVCPAESDMIYPKEYFDFVPPRDDFFYFAMPLYVAFIQRGYRKFFSIKPNGSESAMVVNRGMLLKRMEQMFKGWNQWGPIENEMYLMRRQRDRLEFFNLSIPAITFKTDENMHRKTNHDIHNRVKEIPYWGSIYSLIDHYGN